MRCYRHMVQVKALAVSLDRDAHKRSRMSKKAKLASLSYYDSYAKFEGGRRLHVTARIRVSKLSNTAGEGDRCGQVGAAICSWSCSRF